jgi:uncharacterized protein YlxW (UPF0749 family)
MARVLIRGVGRVGKNAGVPDDDVTGWRRTPGSAPALLDRVVHGALDPAYIDASPRRNGQPATSRRARGASLLALVAAGVLVAVTAYRQAVHAPEQSRAHAALAADVAAKEADTRALAARITQLVAENRTARSHDLADAADAADAAKLSEQIGDLAPAVGQAALHGPGVQVRITEALPERPDPGGTGVGPAAAAAPQRVPGAGKVLDEDIAELVNVLWAAGADAVAVNGVRLTALTAIRSVGQTVLVGFRPLKSPYVIEAIGDAQQLADTATFSTTTVRLRAARAEFGGELVILAMREITLPPAPVTTPVHAGELIP